MSKTFFVCVAVYLYISSMGSVINGVLIIFTLMFQYGCNFQIDQEVLKSMMGGKVSNSQSNGADPSYSIVFPEILKRKVRRSATFEEEDESSSKRVLLKSPSINVNFSLDLVPVTTILSPEFLVLETFQNKSNILPINHHEIRNCLYRSKTAALSMCDGQMLNLIDSIVLKLFIQVQLLYHDPSLGHAVNFILKRLEILKEEPVNLTRPPDIDRFLSSFCNWQRTKNPGGDREPQHWDHALMLTGLDLYVKSKHGKVSSQVVGLAPVAGMCTPTSSCTVNEGRHFESVYVVAHEIGHNLGMRHDGPLADNNCDPTSYIMSPTLGSGKITWSPCSKKYLQTFLDTPQSKCLLDHGNSAGQLDHEAEGNLPGERFNADQQCRLKYGKDSKHSPHQPLEDICRDLHCDREKYTWTSHPALEGTKCGHSMWCRGGKCISRKLNPFKMAYASSPGALVIEKVDGSWSKWKSKGECDSGCLFGEEGRLRSGSTGIEVSVRKCDNPRPQGGGRTCQGIDKRYQTCVAKQCLNVPRLTINEFANQICTRAKDVDKEFTGFGFQKNSLDAQESCAVWCQRRNGQIKARGWSFPDGTVCNMKRGNSTESPTYCINGRCEEFICKSSEETKFLQHSEQCPKIKVASELSQKLNKRKSMEPVENWTVASSCHYNCIVPGKGIRLVFNKHKRKYYTIQLCQPNKQTCNKLKSPLQYASMICRQYKDKVQGLSGFGLQIFPNDEEDVDRPCKVACQDDKILHRFYLVNGKGGWFPFGTECSGRNMKRKAYCVSGKCIEFTQEDVPLSEFTDSLFPKLLRKRRWLKNTVN
ncbi:A disintegrin and metalloproteinase with thrombospondin motifs adt-1 [Agrilus planipennis]|uniref:A disintegrin and metalloproteinase with thrombospondin motifs adt-1 n=1 Tax=Agrilus planipennis TaxID=224129 RepID=A0A1W4XI84_AGRPL|nr:A disintegrin and metalloproteinase with thrombospondin motifs adt-1 [Agrilus planipennis]